MPNPTASPTVTVEGAWLKPITNGAVSDSNAVFIWAESTPVEVPASGEEFDPPSRAVKVTQLMEVKGYEGSVNGDLVERFGVTADTWKDRLLALIRNQDVYDAIQFISPHFFFENVVLGRGYTLDPYHSETTRYRVVLPFVSIEE